MLHWRPVLTFGAVFALMAVASLGGAFHWDCARVFGGF
jgi:hypothetical protein